ncbi:MAG: PhnD/SsuA/transferrin family substrate-binding protein, partial [Candidatus Marithrix sp.]|nr:PhnD/SsuA/transferrin family substrate-binding protein [Candidatus Marithrix sp.]
FGSKYSTMSYLVPRFVLWEAGIGIEQLSNYEFVKNHENVVFGILSGAFDAGAIKEGVFEKNATEGIKVLAWTPPITEHIFVTTQNFTKHEKLQTIFLNINNHPQGKAILTSIKKSITGLAKVKNEDYDGLRNILQTVEKLDH